jgi:hypothetical protein
MMPGTPQTEQHMPCALADAISQVQLLEDPPLPPKNYSPSAACLPPMACPQGRGRVCPGTTGNQRLHPVHQSCQCAAGTADKQAQHTAE